MISATVGPIVGHTTLHSTRIFLRGEHVPSESSYCALRYRLRGTDSWSDPHFAELFEQQDMTAVIALDDLREDARYEFQAGWFSAPHDKDVTGFPNDLSLDWPEALYSFKTATRQKDTELTYVIGSCRYLRVTLGIPSAPALGDRIFKSIHELSEHSSTPLDGLLMIGDQVYLDDLNFAAPDRSYNQILHKYRLAFSQPHIKNLMANVPTYMILDDHEIEDNWPAKKSRADNSLYDNAIRAYEIYQHSHGPQPEQVGSSHAPASHYGYQFTNGDCEWFVLDTRTRRSLSANNRRILDEEQEAALLKWLITSQARVKFIVTTVMFFPDAKNDGDDTWKFFPDQRQRILDTIQAHRIQNVIFIAGDVHGSMTCALSHTQDADFLVHTIVSSPFCNSKLLPYAKTSDFILDRPLESVSADHYTPTLTSAVISQDNFAHISIQQTQVLVNFQGISGELLESVAIPLR